MFKNRRVYCLLFLALFTCSAQAHSVGDSVGFVVGLLHPVLGFDHLLAMVAVGMLSTRLGVRAVWQVPLVFMTVMVLGAIIGISGWHLPSVERGIAASVLALGAAIYFADKLSLIAAGLLVGFFALFHGYAHGVEMPHLANAGRYGLGFVTGTLGLHLLGIGISAVFDRSDFPVLAHKIVAVLIALLGCTLILMLV